MSDSTTPGPGPRSTTVLATAVAAAGGLAAFEVASLAARDGLFLSELPASQLPAVMLAAAVVALVGTLGLSRWLRFQRPDRVAPAALLFSAASFSAIALLLSGAPRLAAVLLYLQVTGVGPVVASSFWSVVNERFDPYEAKRVVARMAAAGALGGVAGGLLAERVATWIGVPTLLFVLAFVCVACALATRSLGPPPAGAPGAEPVDSGSESGLRVLRRVSLLRQMATLMLLVAAVETLVEYALKVEAAQTFQTEESLIRFFAVFYTSCGVLAFGIQSVAGDRFLRRFGLSGAVAMLPLSVAVMGGVGSVVAKLWTVTLARGAETVASTAFFRAGFQLLYTPMATGVKRPAKVWVDVASGSAGDMLGAGLVLGLLAAIPTFPTEGVMMLAVAGSLAALAIVRRVHQGYVSELTQSLQRGQVQIRAEDALDATTARTIVQSQMGLDRRSLLERVREFDAHKGEATPTLAPSDSANEGATEASPARELPSTRAPGGDPTPDWTLVLCSGDDEAIRRALAGAIDTTPGATPERRRRLAGYVIPLLGSDRVGREARNFLRPLAPRIVGQLVDSLLDGDTPVAVRSRLPWILGGLDDARAVDGLWHGLEDPTFGVRVACARAIARIVAREPSLAPSADRIHEVVSRELGADEATWERQAARHYEALGESSVLLSRRALQSVNESLEHVFTLLAVVHERQLVASALAGLSSGDDGLRGTALELLESVLPAGLRRKLWPKLHARPPAREPTRSPEQMADELLRTTTGEVIDLETLSKSN
jgi:hypothetical protein